MAFSAQPQLNSHKVDYLSLAVKQNFIASQGNDTDITARQSLAVSRTVNFIQESNGDRTWLRTRPGLTLDVGMSDFPVDVGNLFKPRIFLDRFLFYSWFNGTTISVGYFDYALNTHTLVGTGYSFEVEYCLFKYINGTNIVFVCGSAGGANARTVNLTTLAITLITDVDMPALARYPVALDNFIFVITANGEIYQSDFDNPLSWTAGNFITSDLTPGESLYMGRSANYIAVFKTGGVEFFYNAGNPSGSVLAQYDSFFRQMTIPRQVPVLFNDMWYFIGQGSNTKTALYSITTSSIDMFVDLPAFQIQNPNADARIYLNYFELLGKPFINIPYSLQAGNPPIYVCYDLLDKNLAYFSISTPGGNSAPWPNQSYYYQGYWYFFDFTSTGAGPRANPRKPLRTGPDLWFVTEDYGNTVVSIVYTGRVDHGTSYSKTCSRVLLDFDDLGSGLPTVTMNFNDNGSNVFAAASRTFQPYPSRNNTVSNSRAGAFLSRIGRYRQRFFRFNFSGAPAKVSGALFDIDIGTN
jgi:hypothetical protein